jgi:type I restriction enzyme M protein
VLGLIFVKYISDTFATRRAELRVRLAVPNGKYFYGDATPEDTDAELEASDASRVRIPVVFIDSEWGRR